MHWTKAHPGPSSDFPGDPCSGLHVWHMPFVVLGHLAVHWTELYCRGHQIWQGLEKGLAVMSTGGGRQLPCVPNAYDCLELTGGEGGPHGACNVWEEHHKMSVVQKLQG